jgi:hypothetical protein
MSLRFKQQMTKGRERGTFKKKKKDSTTATHPHRPVGPARGSILSRPGDIGNPFIVGQILPDLGDLFDPFRPGGILGAKIGMVHVGVQDHGNRGLVPCFSQKNPAQVPDQNIVLRSQSSQSAKLFPQSSALGLPHLLTRRRVCHPPLVTGEGGGRVPIRTRGQTLWYYTVVCGYGGTIPSTHG